MQIREALASKSAAAEGGGETQAAAKATGWGTIKGRFVYDNPAARTAPKPLTITKDVEVCGKHQLVNESLLVDSTGGLANVVLYLRNRNVEVHPDYAASANERAVLDNKDCHFVPHVLAMRTSQPFIIKNSDSVGHNTNAALTANAPFNVIIPAGKEAEEKLSSAETAPATVTCNIHPWMKGYVVVLCASVRGGVGQGRHVRNQKRSGRHSVGVPGLARGCEQRRRAGQSPRFEMGQQRPVQRDAGAEPGDGPQ